MDVRPAEMLAQAVRRVQRRRPSDEGMAVAGELELKLGVRFGFMPYVLELLERAHQRLGHVLASIRTEPPADRMLDHVLPTSWGGGPKGRWGDALINRAPQQVERCGRMPAPCPGPSPSPTTRPRSTR